MIPFQLAILKRLGARELRPYARFAGPRGSLAQGSRLVHRVPLPLRRFRTSLAYGPVNPSNSSASSQIPGFPRAGELVSPSGTSASSQVHEVHLRRGQFARRVPLTLRRSWVSLMQGSWLVRRAPLPLRRSWVSLMQGSWLVRWFLCLFADPRFPSRRGVG